jgi:uncharacterized SAM-binding protein YcdF (DUF218 family)
MAEVATEEPAGHPAGAPRARAGSPLATLFWAGAWGMLMCLLAFAFGGKTGVEKTLTALVMPIGIMWLLLSGWAMQRLASCQWRLSVLPVMMWVAFTLCSTPLLSDACLRYLETREQVFDPQTDADLDVLVVLGGGTRQGPGRAQANVSGDRVVYAAQLYIQGHVRRLITTGSSIAGLFGERTSPREQTLEIWQQLGIPEADIGVLTGINTYQEVQSLKAILPDLQGKRVGVLTSAWHLPRAMRLARAQGMTELIPVAADYQMQVESRSFTDYLPAAGSLNSLSRCQRELMAGLIGR